MPHAFQCKTKKMKKIRKKQELFSFCGQAEAKTARSWLQFQYIQYVFVIIMTLTVGSRRQISLCQHGSGTEQSLIQIQLYGTGRKLKYLSVLENLKLQCQNRFDSLENLSYHLIHGAAPLLWQDMHHYKCIMQGALFRIYILIATYFCI